MRNKITYLMATWYQAHWLGLELGPGALDGVSGLARYRPEFQAFN